MPGFPTLTAPITNTIGSYSTPKVLIKSPKCTNFPFEEVPIFLTPIGKCIVTGFFTIFIKVAELVDDLILSLVIS
jgi:hypothetical protein